MAIVEGIAQLLRQHVEAEHRHDITLAIMDGEDVGHQFET